MAQAYDLTRFEHAQQPVYGQVLAELRGGHKTTHWMWFIFPQIHGLGLSPTAVKFAIESKAEAEAYLQHPVLGPRLLECTEVLMNLKEADADEIFGYPDNLKFHSSMTLFAAVAQPAAQPQQDVFRQALEKFFEGNQDSATIERLR